MFAFDATYDEKGAMEAERAFYVRSILELRRWQTFAPPCFFAVVAVVAVWLKAPFWSVCVFSAFFILSVAGPLFFYVARPCVAARLARSHPTRQVWLTPETIEVGVGDHRAVVAWKRVKYVWEAGAYLLLVLGKFTNISIPHGSLPPGAKEFIDASVKRAA